MSRKASAVANLTVHRNTLEKRQKRERANDLVLGTKKMVLDSDIRAYAVVGIAADGSGHAIWDTGSVVPMWAFADVIAGILRRDLEGHLDIEDWRPPLVQPKP